MTYTPAKTRYDGMLHNRCALRGLMLPAVTLGLSYHCGGIKGTSTAGLQCDGCSI